MTHTNNHTPQATEKNFGDPTEQQAELSELLDVLSGPPGWKADLESFITQALESRENSKVQIVHVEHKEIGGETFTCLYDDKGEKYLHLKKYELDTSFKPSFSTDAEIKVSHLIGQEWKPLEGDPS